MFSHRGRKLAFAIWWVLFCALALLGLSKGIREARALEQAQPDAQPTSVLPELGASAPESGAQPAFAPAAPITPGLSYQTFTSLLFRPIQGNTNFSYNFTYGTLNLLSPSTSAEFFLPLSLPDQAHLRELTYHFIDNQATKDLTMGLCRVQIGKSAYACLHSSVNSTGVNTTAVVERTLTGNPILTIDNASYSYFLIVALNAVSPQYGVITARVGYSRSAYMPVIGQ